MEILLHLTDLHFGQESHDKMQSNERTLCLNALLDAIKNLPTEWLPTVICITGDLVWRGAEADYDLAKGWLDKLLIICGLHYDKVVVCPGNHEVIRAEAVTIPRPSNAVAADKALIAPPPKHYQAPFVTFTKFCHEMGIPALYLGEATSHLVGQRLVNGIRFVVLNTAWCSQDNEDENQLWLGIQHVKHMEVHGQLLPVSAQPPLTVCLMHHPPDWLHPSETSRTDGRPNSKDYLALRCHILLTGHTHGEVREPDRIAQGAVHFTGGATFHDAKYENNLCLIRLDADQLTYLPITYQPGAVKNTWRKGEAQSLLLPGATSPDLPPRLPPLPPRVVHLFFDRIQRYVPRQLIGREPELALLDQAWAEAQSKDCRRRIVSINGLGGEGKTSLVAKWLAQKAEQTWPDCDFVFAWTFYSQGAFGKAGDIARLFFQHILTALGHQELAESSASAHEKGETLAKLLGERRSLLVLDGLEPLQYPPTATLRGELTDAGMVALLNGLAANRQGLCILTTRYEVQGLWRCGVDNMQNYNLPQLPLDAAVRLLEILAVRGSLAQLETLATTVKGHALTLNLLAVYINEACDGDIRRHEHINFVQANEQEQGGHAFRVMDAYVAWLETDINNQGLALASLRLTGLFDRAADMPLIQALCVAPGIPGLTDPLIASSNEQRTLCWRRLEKAGLLTVVQDSAGNLLALDTHPLIREYFSRQLQARYPHAWRAAHECLFHHLHRSALDEHYIDAEKLHPLYQAVVHGCQAGDVCAAYELFRRRIAGPTLHSTNHLGALGPDFVVLAGFFEKPWSVPAAALPKQDQAWLLNAAAFHLRAVGRVHDAGEPAKAAIKALEPLNNVQNVAIAFHNLSQIELGLGHISSAIGLAKQAMDCVVENASGWTGFASNHAAILHCAGKMEQASAAFANAEQRQLDRDSSVRELYGVEGFRYNEFLLAEVERACWRLYLTRATPDPTLPWHRRLWQTLGAMLTRKADPVAQHIAQCHSIKTRAQHSREKVGKHGGLLIMGLDDLILGTVQLFLAILQNQSRPENPDLSRAMVAIRRAAQADEQPRVLLMHAWQQCMSHNLAEAHTALEEARQIAERGPLPLFLADVLLYRARLFAASAEYPWSGVKDDLVHARKLIERHSYLRRLEELQDAEALLVPTANTSLGKSLAAQGAVKNH